MALLCRQYVPPELINAIVGHLSEDKQSLRACSLVSRSFTEPSQRQLFHYFILRINDDDAVVIKGNTEHFQAILEILDVQFTYICALCITIGRCAESTPALIQVLERINHPEAISIICQGTPNEDLIRHCCKPTAIRFTIFLSKQFPIYYLRQCPLLQELCLYSATLSSERPDAATCYDTDNVTFVPVRPKSLILLFCPADVFDFCHTLGPHFPISMQDVTEFSLYANQMQDMQPVLPLFSVFAHSLVSFKVSPPMRYSLPAGEESQIPFILVDLSLLSRLARLTLCVEEGFTHTILPWVIAQLSTTSNTNIIREIHLQIEFAPSFSPTDLDEISQRWTKLDDVLVEPKFSSLQIVNILIKSGNEGLRMITSSWPQSVLSKTNGCKTLCMKFLGL